MKKATSKARMWGSSSAWPKAGPIGCLSWRLIWCAAVGSMYLNEGGAVRIVAMHNAPPSFAEERRRNPLIPPDTTLGRILATKQTVQIADVQNEPAHINAPS